MRLAAAAALVGLAAPINGRPGAQTPPFDALLNRYAAGEFAAVAAELERIRDPDGLLTHLQTHGAAWIAAGGEAQRAGRELAAATLALEAARIHAWDEWKIVQKQPPMGSGGKGGDYVPPDVLYWRAPPRLIEWGCQIVRAHTDRLEAATKTSPRAGDVRPAATSPRAMERWWQLAALSVAQRAEDHQFLIGNPFGVALANPQIEIEHLNHVRPRFKDEPRFALAQGIAVEWRWGAQALPVFDSLKDDVLVGAEARMRAGAVFLRQSRRPLAIVLFDEVESRTRDPYVIFLARYFKGQALEETKRLDAAVRAYRGAAAAVPHAQSASVALAALLFRMDRRAEAQRIAGEMLHAQPAPVDPWRAYVHADDRFWPQLIARVRAGILP
jgi:tetratricopeptide (TPR) repeat protein